tara:strand:- start:44 stop:208 length:165 start_codon:yes stop_codon:yes gene_type:complete
MTVKIVDRKVKSSPRGFKSLMIKYLDTKTKKTWWTEGDLSKELKINGKGKKANT